MKRLCFVPLLFLCVFSFGQMGEEEECLVCKDARLFVNRAEATQAYKASIPVDNPREGIYNGYYLNGENYLGKDRKNITRKESKELRKRKRRNKDFLDTATGELVKDVSDKFLSKVFTGVFDAVFSNKKGRSNLGSNSKRTRGKGIR